MLFRALPVVDDKHWEARQVDETHYEVVGKGLERMVAMTDLENEFALRRLQKSLDKLGVTKRLKSIGAQGTAIRCVSVTSSLSTRTRTRWTRTWKPPRKASGGARPDCKP